METNFNIYKVKNYTEYTKEELLELISKARTPYEYDCIIDRLYFNDLSTTKKWIPRALNIKSARRMRDIEKSESHSDLLFDMETAKEYMKKNA